MTLHEQYQALSSILDGAFLTSMVALLSWVVNSFYLHVLQVTRKPINPDTILSNVLYDKDLAKHVLDDLIHHAEEVENMKLKPVKKISAIVREPEVLKASVVYVSPEPVLPMDVVAKVYTIRQLKALASEQKVKGYSNMTKAQLLEVVKL